MIVTLVGSEMAAPSSDLIGIAAVTRSQSRLASGNNDMSSYSVTLSDDKNRMLKGIDMIKFKELKETDCFLQTVVESNAA